MRNSNYSLDNFYFNLPENLVSQFPMDERDRSKLMLVERFTGKTGHFIFSDLVTMLTSGDLLVFNNARVLNGRLYFIRETGGKVEIILIKKKAKEYGLPYQTGRTVLELVR